MPVQIGAKPDSGFDDPLGILKDCHRRIERFLGVLCLVAERANGRALDAEEAEAVRAALRYFRESGRRHNADEEESLFPRLQHAPEILAQLNQLEEEHARSNRLHDSVDQQFTAWLAEGSPHDPDRLLRETSELREIYTGHIQLEEDLVFPRAAALLPPRTIAQMGEEFRARRNRV